ncbi:MAG: hypothetical protein ABIO83_00425 [Ilumatobacteraceae bacterium]
MLSGRHSGTRRAVFAALVVLVGSWGGWSPIAAADEPVGTGIVEGAVVAVGSAPVRGTEVVAVDVPPVTATSGSRRTARSVAAPAVMTPGLDVAVTGLLSPVVATVDAGLRLIDASL